MSSLLISLFHPFASVDFTGVDEMTKSGKERAASCIFDCHELQENCHHPSHNSCLGFLQLTGFYCIASNQKTSTAAAAAAEHF